MKKIIYALTLVLLIFTFNTNFQITPAIAENAVIQDDVLNSEDTAIDNSTDDVLDKPIFDEKKPQSKTSKITGKLSSWVIKIVGLACILLIAAFCLFFIVLANKQRQQEMRKKKMSANANVINAIDNFARHRIKK